MNSHNIPHFSYQWLLFSNNDDELQDVNLTELFKTWNISKLDKDEADKLEHAITMDEISFALKTWKTIKVLFYKMFWAKLKVFFERLFI